LFGVIFIFRSVSGELLREKENNKEEEKRKKKKEKKKEEGELNISRQIPFHFLVCTV
jgi:hypothetical protein